MLRSALPHKSVVSVLVWAYHRTGVMPSLFRSYGLFFASERPCTGSGSLRHVPRNFKEPIAWPVMNFSNNFAGSVYTYSTGAKQHLYISQPELVKELNQCFTLLGKPSYLTKRLAPMLGNGILRSNGPSWAQQRKIVAPEFFMDKVKVLHSIPKTIKLQEDCLCILNVDLNSP